MLYCRVFIEFFLFLFFSSVTVCLRFKTIKIQETASWQRFLLLEKTEVFLWGYHSEN